MNAIPGALDNVVQVKSQRGEPTWEIATLYPNQGEWTEEAYLSLHFEGLVELSDGCLEFLPMPTLLHQLLVEFLYWSFKAFVDPRKLGKIMFAPLRVQLWSGKIREPDLIFFRMERAPDLQRPLAGVDLAVEVVSGSRADRERDLTTKRQEYAAAGIAEYWIVDPQEQRITVLTLAGASYREHGVFAPGQQATSVLLEGFAVDVAAVFAAGNPLTPNP